MEINPQLITWLKWHSDNGERDITLNMMKDGDLADVPTTKVMLDECLRVGLIQVTGIELYNGTMPRYIHYKLSDIGEIALSIPPQPATRTPVSDSGAYTWELTSDGTEVARVYNDEFDFSLDSYSEALDLLHVLCEYESETAALRAELAAARERIAALAKYADGLAAENSALGIVISSVGIKVNDARDLLFDEKYAAADSALKNAQVIIQANRKTD